MQVLTSQIYLRKIAEYQDGISFKDMKIQPDLAAKEGHVNLLSHKGTYKPTPEAFMIAMQQKEPSKMVHFLVDSGTISDFVLGDALAAHGQADLMRQLVLYEWQHPKCTQYSFNSFRHAIVGGHLEILQLLCEKSSLNFYEFSPHMFALAAASGQEAVMDWLYTTAGRHGSVSLDIQYEALVYHLSHCGVCDIANSSEDQYRHEQCVIKLLAANPTLLIQIQCNSRTSKAIDCCAAGGNLTLLQLLFAYHGRESHCALDHAAKHGHLPVVRYLTGQGDSDEENGEGADADAEVNAVVVPSGEMGMDDAAIYVILPAISESRCRGRYTVHATNRAITEAALAGHAAVVDYLATHRFEGADSKLFDQVAGKGNLSMLTYISAHLNDYFPNVVITTDALDNAAANGHLAVVEYLTQDPLRHEGGTTDAMDRAAANGHLECMQWLYRNRTEGCTTEAFDNAAANNRKTVVEWLHEEGLRGSDVNANARVYGTARAIDLAAGNGLGDMVRWLHGNYHADTLQNLPGSPVSTSVSPSSLHEPPSTDLFRLKHTLPCPTRLAYDSAAGNGCLDILQFLLSHYDNLLSVATVEFAARGGHVLVLQWLYDNYTDMFLPQYTVSEHGYHSGSRHSPVKLGAGHGLGAVGSSGRSSKRVKTVQESYDVTTAPLAEALSLAIRHGQCQAVRWLLTTLRIDPTQSDIDWAARNGHLAMLLLLQDHCNHSAKDVRPSLKSLEWSVLNGHIPVVQYLLCLSNNRPHASLTGPMDFGAKQAAIYARRYGQSEVLRVLEHYIPHACTHGTHPCSSSPQTLASSGSGTAGGTQPHLETSNLGDLGDISSVLVNSPSLIVFPSYEA